MSNLSTTPAPKKMINSSDASHVCNTEGLRQAISWGYKSIKEAELDGCNVRPGTMTFSEIADQLGITEQRAIDLCVKWRDKDWGHYSRVCGLDTFYFRTEIFKG